MPGAPNAKRCGPCGAASRAIGPRSLAGTSSSLTVSWAGYQLPKSLSFASGSTPGA